jgi:predicted ester cyclase
MKTTIIITKKKFIACMTLTLSMSLFTYAQTADSVGEWNKEVIRKYQERINSGDTKGAVEYISDEMMNFGRVVGKKGIELVLNDVFVTFPDWQAETLEMVAVGNAVILRQKLTGTHLGMGKHRVNGGMLAGVQPTGKRFEVTHMHWYILRDGKIVGHYGNRDDLGMMQQLGLVPVSLASRDSIIVR